MTGRRRTRTSGRVAAGLGLLALLAVPGGVGAQEQGGAVDGRWLPWLGCWEVVGEPADDGLLCVRPSPGDDGVELQTVVDGQVRGRELRVAGDEPRRVAHEGCAGTERATFSDDGRRVYMRSHLTCEGAVERTTSGLMALATPYEWIDVQAVEVAGRSTPLVQRYRRVGSERSADLGVSGILEGRRMAARSARIAAAAAPDVDDVVEASRHADAGVVEAWIAERDDPFDLDADGLLRLADAQVSQDVIDLMVAVSYPERFQVARGGDDYGDRPGRRGAYGRGYGGVGWGLGSWYGWGGLGYGASPYLYGRYGYSPWAVGGYYGLYRGYRPGIVVVQPRSGRDSEGRAIKGRGYRRGGPRDSRDASPSRGLVPSDRSGGSVSPSGHRGGDSSSTGRKAKPRKPPPGSHRGGGGGEG